MLQLTFSPSWLITELLCRSIFISSDTNYIHYVGCVWCTVSRELAMIGYLIIFALVLAAIFAHKLRYPGSDIHNLPGPRPLPLIGSALSLVLTAEKVIPTVDAFQKKYGRLFLIWFGLIPAVNIITPQGAEALLNNKKNIQKGRAYNLLRPWLGEGLLTSDGQRWFSHRRLITPTFHFSILENFLAVFEEHARILVECFQPFSEKGSPVEIGQFVTRCTLDVISEAAMGVKIHAQKQDQDDSSHDEKTSQYIKSIFRIAQLSTVRILNPLFRSDFVFFLTRLGRSYLKHLEIVHGFAENVIRARREANQEQSGKRLAFLDLLLKAQDQDGQPLSDQDIREEVDTFMFEGHDTTAAAIVWTLYLLGKNQEIQEGIYQELFEIFENEDRPVTLADLAQMKYLERSIKESLRLYPSVPNVTRTVTDDLEIEGYKLPKGTSVILHIYHLHRNPEYFPNPEKYDPDRFLPENTQKRHPYAYVPFSAGSRNCIGQRFAMLEEKLILSQILRAFKVQFLDDLQKDLIRTELTLRPPPGMRFRFTKRQSSISGNN